MRQALIIVDMIHDFVDGKFGSPQARAIVDNIKTLINWAHDNKIPVIYLKDAHGPDDPEIKIWGEHALSETKGSEIIEELTPAKNDIVIPKQTYSGFFRTHLESILNELECKQLILTGVSTNICVQHTAADAFFRGFDIVVVSDATASINEKSHLSALEYMKNIYGAQIKTTKELVD